MRFYKHHIGDFRSATTHLSHLERAMYHELLAMYYDTEAPLPLDDGLIFRKVGAKTRPERAAVASILHDFFVRTDDGYKNGRCDKEIAHYQEKRDQALRAAAARKGLRGGKRTHCDDDAFA